MRCVLNIFAVEEKRVWGQGEQILEEIKNKADSCINSTTTSNKLVAHENTENAAKKSEKNQLWNKSFDRVKKRLQK